MKKTAERVPMASTYKYKYRATRVVDGVGHLGHVEAMECGYRELEPRPGHYRRIEFLFQPGNCLWFSHPNMPFFPNSEFI